MFWYRLPARTGPLGATWAVNRRPWGTSICSTGDSLRPWPKSLDVESAELVIGLGAGRALDASKYVALANDLPLVLVPSVVSTGAIIHALVAKWDGRRILGGTADWAWVECEHVLVDYDLALEAPYYLNTGGLGDCLSGYSGVAEWRHNARNGVGPPVEEETVGRVLAGFDAMADEFPKTLDAQGRLTADSIHYISVALQERDGKGLRHPAAPAADHPFLQAIELVNDMGWVHGELAALGSIIVAWQCGENVPRLSWTGWTGAGYAGGPSRWESAMTSCSGRSSSARNTSKTRGRGSTSIR